jgi:hypothetical protein
LTGPVAELSDYAYYDFFKEVQKKLHAQGVRNVYGLGLNVTTNGNDPNNVFN